jgi:hypothetical protein
LEEDLSKVEKIKEDMEKKAEKHNTRARELF